VTSLLCDVFVKYAYRQRHIIFKNKERYLMLGEVCRKVVESMQDKDVWDFFIQTIKRTAPKLD
jgi:hypothetical protein